MALLAQHGVLSTVQVPITFPVYEILKYNNKLLLNGLLFNILFGFVQ